MLEFPVSITGEIDGTVYLKNRKGKSGVSSVNLQLVDSNGKVVKETNTAFDGFYLLDFIIPGRYRLRVSPEQLLRLKLNASPKEEVVEIGMDGTVISGIDFLLERIAKKRAPAQAPEPKSKPVTSQSGPSPPTGEESRKPDAQVDSPAVESAAPAVEKPAEPAAEEQALPAAEEPALPAAEEPAQPAAEEPAPPAAEEPAPPAEEEPAPPAEEEPAPPAVEEPAPPAAEEPEGAAESGGGLLEEN